MGVDGGQKEETTVCRTIDEVDKVNNRTSCAFISLADGKGGRAEVSG
jgi:hypothetical protein